MSAKSPLYLGEGDHRRRVVDASVKTDRRVQPRQLSADPGRREERDVRDLVEQVERRKIAQTEQMGDERSRLLRQQIGANARPAPTTATNVDRLSCGFTLADLGFF